MKCTSDYEMHNLQVQLDAEGRRRPAIQLDSALSSPPFFSPADMEFMAATVGFLRVWNKIRPIRPIRNSFAIYILLIGGTDTSTLTVEWALALLLANATALAKVVAELDDHIGNSRLINESDLPNLPYLNSVIKETLRLRPVGPIIPHESSENCTVSGYEVPRGTMLYVNVWAIQRDPDLWPDPEAFRPERWVQGEEEEILGRSKSGRFLAFGMGRRGCPGEAMAMRMIGLVLGALLHFFEWELGAGEVVDLSEGLGISMPMAKPLTAICKPRQRFI